MINVFYGHIYVNIVSYMQLFLVLLQLTRQYRYHHIKSKYDYSLAYSPDPEFKQIIRPC